MAAIADKVDLNKPTGFNSDSSSSGSSSSSSSECSTCESSDSEDDSQKSKSKRWYLNLCQFKCTSVIDYFLET